MKGSNFREPVVDGNEDIDWEVRPGGMLVQKRDAGDGDHVHAGGGGPAIKINVVHGLNRLDLVVPSQSTFGDLKRYIAKENGLEPDQQRLLFRGKEKEDQEYLHLVGVKDNAKVLLMEDPRSKEKMLKEVKCIESSSACSTTGEARQEQVEEVKSSNLPRDFAAVAEVRAEVDKLAEQVTALEAAVSGGTKGGEKEFVVLGELLMRQLLKLDSIEAEGEGKVQRKLEVNRVQSLVDKVDSLKARNSNPFSGGSSSKTVSVTTKWETFGSGMGSLSAPSPMPSSTKVTEDWEVFD
ncbi:BAG family molecular chaperone regulator 4 [Diospyros lotus]|uniref:BAG family molecular chaperone regulator 4 n=1 Tax=Diospyros lotus TaxID=55363 RepID=UPI0022570F23|nr:BAG family molecular chaperone regulator 4 [Diospyros lotus]